MSVCLLLHVTILKDNFWNVISDYSEEDSTLPTPHMKFVEEDVSMANLIELEVPEPSAVVDIVRGVKTR